MWAIRQASTNSLKASGLKITALRACSALGPISSHTKDNLSASKPHLFNRWITSKTCISTVAVSKLFSTGCRSISSQAGGKNGEDEIEKSEDGFSELVTFAAFETAETGIVDGSSSSSSDSDSDSSSDSDSTSDSESDLDSLDASLEDAFETELPGDTVENAGSAASKTKYAPSALQKLIMEESGSIFGALDKYFEDKELSRLEVYQVLSYLHKRRLFVQALQLSEWLERRDDFDFLEGDYASRIGAIAKLHGLKEAESYVDTIPESFREEVVYRTLLKNFISVKLVDKSEQLFNKMKNLGFPITVSTYNQMLLLYKLTDKRKIGDLLLMMEKENIKPSAFTYQLLIDTKGHSKDIKGMELIVETMKAEGLEPDLKIQAVLARHYAAAGLREKAEEVLKDMEGKDLMTNRFICPTLLLIYASLGKPEEVERIWKQVEPITRQADFFAAITAWGKLKNIEKSEAIFDKMIKTYKTPSTKHYSVMLRVYTENKMFSKGMELLKQMPDANTSKMGPMAWDALVMMYVGVGEAEQAISVLHKATEKKQRVRPMLKSYITVLDHYSERGNVHNVEKVFQMMKQAGYFAGSRAFSSLLQTYINANVPAYGMRERMKADDLKINDSWEARLALVDVLRKTSVSDLLD
ncbi:pentatricopeptide repeat-containing protein At1g80270, mitochondrial-like [Silene latifolia]|uniref:pentatricopeptide repeat-containing protein At1g80270, mitochondrial-like n=1 Tax=Silene latifolia TaxID=37657 RepID=UPI003D789136